MGSECDHCDELKKFLADQDGIIDALMDAVIRLTKHGDPTNKTGALQDILGIKSEILANRETRKQQQ